MSFNFKHFLKLNLLFGFCSATHINFDSLDGELYNCWTVGQPIADYSTFYVYQLNNLIISVISLTNLITIISFEHSLDTGSATSDSMISCNQP